MNRFLNFIEENYKIIVIIFFIGLLILGITIYDDYGLSVDAGVQRFTGWINFRYIFEKDRSLIDYKDRYYGPVFELFLIFIEKMLNLTDSKDIYLTRHLVTFLLFYVSVIFFYFLCNHRFRSWKFSLLGCLFLILSPRIFGHSFFNSKDLPFLSVFIIAVYTLVKYLDKKTFLRASIHALICALLIDIRVTGILIPSFTFFFVVVDWIIRTKEKKSILTLLLYIALLIPLTILFWPILWEGPVYHFIQAFKTMQHFQWAIGHLLYLGKYIEAADLPWHYIPVWISITTPIFYTLCFLIGAFVSIIFILKSPLTFYFDFKKRHDLIFLALFFAPLIAVIVFNSTLYNGWRQMFFIYPCFLIISLRGIVFLFKKLQPYRVANIVLLLSILFSVISTVEFMIKGHPYQNFYFNLLVGKDIDRIRKRFEFDYWSLVYREALEYIVKKDPCDTIKIFTRYGWHNKELLDPIDKKRIKFVKKPEDAKYSLGNYSWMGGDVSYDNEFYSVKLREAKILVVYKL